MLDFYQFKEALNSFPKRFQTSLTLAFCERMFPGYSIFCEKYNLPKPLRQILNQAWIIEEGDKYDRFVIDDLESQAESVAPDTEDYQDILVSSALDACLALSFWFKFKNDKDINSRNQILDFGRDTLDMYIQVLEDMDTGDSHIDEEVEKHFLVKQELDRQAEDIILAKNMASNELLFELKRKYKNKNIGLIVD